VSGKIVERTESGKLTERTEYGKITEEHSMEVKNRVWRDREQTYSERPLTTESGKITEGHSLETPMNGHILERPLKKEFGKINHRNSAWKDDGKCSG
jgi:hypothetical protein